MKCSLGISNYLDIVQETGIKTIPMENKCKKAKWLSEEALQVVVKRREVKSKGEKDRYSHLNADFQRIARREKKAFFRDQCKETEENNRMGKTPAYTPPTHQGVPLTLSLTTCWTAVRLLYLPMPQLLHL